MPELAIRSHALSKRYRIGARRADTLKDAIATKAGSLAPSARRQRREERTIWALNDVDFEVRHGEAVGVIGHNGAGKTTLLKILSRITYPTRGHAELHGRVGSLLEVGTGFHPELTGRENVYLSGSILGMKKREIDTRFEEIVSFAGIEKFLETPVKRYSSGMGVRLAFAVAAHLEPEILLIDEVLAVGDAAFQRKCLGKMSDVTQEGRTVVFVTHQLGTLRQLCPRTVLLERGEVVADGPTEEIVRRYLASQSDRGPAEIVPDLYHGSRDHIRFVRAALVGEDGEPTHFGRPGEELRIRYTIEALHDLRDTRLNLMVATAFGDRLLTVSDSDSAAGIPRTISRGSETVEVTLPGIFRPGTYYIGLGAHQVGPGGWWTYVPNAVEFEIEDTIHDSYNIGWLRVPATWSISPADDRREP